jgi:hypothetical protein
VEESVARDVVERLRARGAFAHAHPVGVYRYSVRIVIPDGREAIWDADGAAGLEAVIMRNGVLVGLVEHVDGSEHFDVAQVVDAILRADYDAPLSRAPRTPPRTDDGGALKPPAPPTPPPAARPDGVAGKMRRLLGLGD